MNWLDSAIAWVSPVAALRRVRARTALETARAYEGGRNTRRTQGWSTGPGSANSEISGSLTNLRNRSRDLVRNSPYGSRAIDALVSNAIGTGITARWPGRNDSLWKDWTEECDFYGELFYNGLQALEARSVFESGEVLVRRRWARVGQYETVPLKLQVLEPDYLDMTKTGPMPGGLTFCINGIEFDLAGRRVRYWLFDEHPGEMYGLGLKRSWVSKPVPAEDIVHIFEKRRPGQVRGVPRLGSSLMKLRDLDEYEEAELVRKKIEACFTAFVRTNRSNYNVSDNTATDTSKNNQPRIETLSPGMIMYGSEEDQITFGSPSTSRGYGDYTITQLRAIAAGAGLTYELLTGDHSKANFSSMRGARQEFRALIEQFRWLTFIPMGDARIARWFVEAALLCGRLGTRSAKYKATWTPPRWEYIQPLDDVKTTLLEIAGGLKTQSEALRERNQDVEEFLEEKVNEAAQFKAANVPLPDTGAVAAGSSAPNTAGDTSGDTGGDTGGDQGGKKKTSGE